MKTIKQLTDAATNNSSTHPRWLPDGRHLLYYAHTGSGDLTNCMMDIDGKPVNAFTDSCIESVAAIDWLAQ